MNELKWKFLSYEEELTTKELDVNNESDLRK